MQTPISILNARLLDPASGRDETGGIRIEQGLIKDIGSHVRAVSGDEIIEAGGKVLAPGLVDLCVRTGEPGAEHRETLASAGQAAARGGVTTMLVMPDTEPVIDTSALVDFVLRRGRDTACVRVLSAAALTKGLSGTQMSEIGLLQESGAAAFTDGGHTIEDAGVLARALCYTSRFSPPVFLKPDTPSMTRGSDVTQGMFADTLGLKGAAPAAEWIGVERDVILAEMTEASLVVDRLSTGRALQQILEARRRGVSVACTVSAAHLFFNALDVGDYLTHAKLSPPLRDEADRQVLIEGLARGDIDAVVSAHNPQPAENKRLPFAQAAFGAVGLETLLASVLALVHEGHMDLRAALAPLTCGPASLLGLECGQLAIGSPADMILLDPDAPWVCRNEDLCSRSRNSPYDGRRMQGLVLWTMVAGQSVFVRKP